ncbi:hypothetical protein PTTG_04216 [Puccinia triticina 1-1 BBBD Race 1]|uniref:Globin-sensor domain-containing protein n=1 Tax=Puccinia triticina (isolate 1-1 / race 1 (BBBD)) TaxID=630390 RepID=A0A180GPP1_PUCT1|nr:hypothetical protein PTTG_04216 [Puccinia triticina 1-1 BBBD Race 1]WAR61601.1 hypothetical protein PtB15_12B291 [Puccinia triticina]
MDPETVTRAELNSDLASRVRYMKAFLDFTEEDCQIMDEVRPIAKPLVPEIVASAYTKLLSYDACRMAFFPRKDGAQGTHGSAEDLVDGNDHLSLNSATIKLRRNILERWAMRIFTADYHQLEIFEFFDQVGIQHTGGARVFSSGTHKPVYIDYIHLAMTLGYITSKMTSAILTLPSRSWPNEKKTRAVMAFHKISAIHNDLIARHHIGDLCSPPTSRTQTPEQEISPQNRKDYYNHVFMVGSPSGLNIPQVPSPPRDAPFQSLVSITPQSSSSSRPYVSQLGELPQLTSVQRTMTSTSEFYNPHKSISSFGGNSAYFPGSYEESQTLTRRASKGTLNKRKFGTRIKKTHPS